MFSIEKVNPNVNFSLSTYRFLQLMDLISGCEDLPNELEELKGVLKVRVRDEGEYFETEDLNRLVETSI